MSQQTRASHPIYSLLPMAARVMHTDEEFMIAETVCHVLGLSADGVPP